MLAAMVVLAAGLSVMASAGSLEATRMPGTDPVRQWNSESLGPMATLTPSAYLPAVLKIDPCSVSSGETYGSLTVNEWEPAQYPAHQHPDINLAIRGYTPTNYHLGLINLGGSWTDAPPQLAGLFSPLRAPNILANYQVYGWDWNCMCRIGPISPPGDPEVTLIELAAGPGEFVRLPDRQGGDIGDGYKALVLYATSERLTLKYTRDDHVIWGYTLHVENVCADPNLLALYTTLNAAGRHSLPALRPGQVLGRARSNRVGVAIRDVGTFMDPRARYDWWLGY